MNKQDVQILNKFIDGSTIDFVDFYFDDETNEIIIESISLENIGVLTFNYDRSVGALVSIAGKVLV